LAAKVSGPNDAFAFEGACSPYFDRSIIHRRHVAEQQGRWTVTDEVSGAADAPVTSYLHLHPDFTLRTVDTGRFVLGSPRATVAIEPFGVDRIELRRGENGAAQGWHCPEFGVRLPAVVLEMCATAGRGQRFGYHISLI
jgi:hypothetical protein